MKKLLCLTLVAFAVVTVASCDDEETNKKKDAVKNKEYAGKAGKNKTYTRDGKKSSKSYKKSAE